MVTSTKTDLTSYLSLIGIHNSSSIIYQPSYSDLYNYETDETNDVREKAINTNLGAVSVDTGKFTGRSAKDKYIVMSKFFLIFTREQMLLLFMLIKMLNTSTTMLP